jgi:serine/threonine protein kinase
VSRGTRSQRPTVATIGELLERIRVVAPGQWSAAAVAVGSNPDDTDYEQVLLKISTEPAWWSKTGEPTLNSFQCGILRNAARNARMPTVGAFRLVHYLLLEQLGVGGMAKVYRAYDLEKDRIVAVKRVAYSNQETKLRFKRESKILEGLRHPGINRYLACHTLRDSALVVLEYIPGRNLAEYQKSLGGPLPWREAAQFISQAAEALTYAHERGVLHRDIKPHNMQISKETGKLVLLDFGLAKVRTSAEAEWDDALGESTQGGDGREIGTPYYMSPEHWTGSKHVVEASDIYSLGCLFFELLAGRAPFKGPRPTVIKGHCVNARPSVRDFAPHQPIELDLLIQQMMAIRPGERPSLALIRNQIKKLLARRKPQDSAPEIELQKRSGEHRPIKVVEPECLVPKPPAKFPPSETLNELIGPDDRPVRTWKVILALLSFPWKTISALTTLAIVMAIVYFVWMRPGSP